MLKLLMALRLLMYIWQAKEKDSQDSYLFLSYLFQSTTYSTKGEVASIVVLPFKQCLKP